VTTRGKYTSTRRADGGWKVPLAIKIGIALIGSFFILIALIGSLVHGQANMTNGTEPQQQHPSTSALESAKGCIGNDQTTGKTYIDVRCLQDPNLVWTLCTNWLGNNATFPMGINCGWANQTKTG
jgi:hypothetical protein